MIPTPQRIVVCDLETILKKVCLSCIDICRRSEDLETVGKVTHYFLFLWTPTWLHFPVYTKSFHRVYIKMKKIGSGWRLLGFYCLDIGLTFITPQQ